MNTAKTNWLGRLTIAMATSKHHPRKLRTIVIDRRVIEPPDATPYFLSGLLIGAMAAVAVMAGAYYTQVRPAAAHRLHRIASRD